MFNKARQLFFISIFIISTSLRATPPKTIKVILGEELKGNQFISESLPVFREVFSREGIAIEVHYFPWKRALHAIQLGNFEAIGILKKNNERQKILAFADDPFTISRRMLYHLKAREIQWDNYNDLKGLRAGGLNSYEYCAEFMELVNRGEIKLERTYEMGLNIKKLMANRLDFIIMHEIKLPTFVKQIPADDARKIAVHSKPFSEVGYYFAFPRNNPYHKEIKALFDRNFKEVNKSGRVRTIYDTILKRMMAD